MIEGDIELVCIEDIGYFFFKDDRAYEVLRTKQGDITLDYEPRAFAHNLRGIQDRFRRERSNGFFKQLIKAWNIEPDIFDVGVHVGRWSMPLSLFAQQQGLDSKIYLFEPGRTVSLLPYTIEANALENTQIIEAIVSDYTGIGMLRFSPNELVAARAYKPGFPHVTRLCRTVSLDSIRKQHSSTKPALVKIDTEGHEVSVLKGAQDLLNEGQYIVTLEYRDWLMDKGKDILMRLYDSSHVFDLGQNLSMPYIVPVHQLEGHFERVSKLRLRGGETDLLFVSKKLENLSAVLETITKFPRYEE